MERPSDFKLLKQKIINTHNLFVLYKQQNEELKQVKGASQRSRDEIDKLKLKSNSTHFIEKSFNNLKQQHDELTRKYKKLEDDYHTVVNSWQIKYQLVSQELTSCQMQDEIKKKRSPKSNEWKIKYESSQKEMETLQERINKYDNQIEELKSENSALQLELSLQSESLGEIDSLQKKNEHFKEKITKLNLKIKELNTIPSDELIGSIMKETSINSRLSPIPSSPRRKIKKIIRNRKITKRKMKKKIDLFGTLLALRKANINFCISNESLLPRTEPVQEVYIPPQLTCYKPVRIKQSVASHRQLDCNLCCNAGSYLMLKSKNDENSSLLGFFNVKPENEEESNKKRRLSDADSGLGCDNFDIIVNENENKKIKERHKERKVVEENRKCVSNTESCSKDEKESNPLPIDEEVESSVTESEGKKSLNQVASNCSNNKRKIVSRKISTSEKDSEITKNPDLGCYGFEIVNETDNKKTKVQNKATKTANNRKLISKTESCSKDEGESISASHSVSLPINEETTENSIVKEHKETKSLNEVASEASSCNLSKRKVVSRKTRTSALITTDSEIKFPTKKSTSESTNSCGRRRKSVSPKINEVENENSPEKEVKKIKISPVKSKPTKTTYKRPTCRTRQSLRLLNNSCDNLEISKDEDVSEDRPASPPVNERVATNEQPKIIPLEKIVPERAENMVTSKVEMLFGKLVSFSKEEESLNEIVKEFLNQDPEYVARAIIETVAKDYQDTPDSKYSPAPIMTETQRTMLGFMSKLEKTGLCGVFSHFLALAEQRLLTTKKLEEIAPITRLYLAVCKLQKNLHRMRKLCCDVFYFCGDFAVPFLFAVLTSWMEVLPHEADSREISLVRVLIQVVYMKECNKPGYNLLPLRDLLIKFYGYPSERWNSDELFLELYNNYLKNPTRTSDFPILILCKNHPDKWVNEKIDEYLKPLVEKVPNENFKATVIILIGNLSHRFSSKAEVDYINGIRAWLRSLVTENTTPDVVRRSVYLCMKRLRKK